MQTTVRKEIAASADTVWSTLTNFRIPPKHLGFESSSLEGEGVGHVRTLRFAGGERVIERLEALDNDARSMHVSLSVEDARIPWKDSQCVVNVFETDENRCTMECVVSFDSMGVDEARSRRSMEGIYLGFMTAIEEELTSVA